MKLTSFSSSLLCRFGACAVPSISRWIVESDYALGEDNLIDHVCNVRTVLTPRVCCLLLLYQNQSLIKGDADIIRAFYSVIPTLSFIGRRRVTLGLTSVSIASTTSTAVGKRGPMRLIWVLVWSLFLLSSRRIRLGNWFAVSSTWVEYQRLLIVRRTRSPTNSVRAIS